MSQPGSTDKAPSSTDKITADVHPNSGGSLSRPGRVAQAAEKRRRPCARIYPPSFELERSVGPKGRHSYSTATKLRVVDYTRLPCPNGGVVGNRGAATGLGQGLCPKRIRDWVQNEDRLRKEKELGGGGKGKKKVHAGAAPATKGVEAELVDYINVCRKLGVEVTRVVVMCKLMALQPDAFGGIPSDDPPAMERFHQKFKKWYQGFRRRNKFSLQTSVGQKKPSLSATGTSMAASGGNELVMDTFVMRQFTDDTYTGTKVAYDPQEFEDKVNEIFRASGGELAEGYAPFCKHVFVPNFAGVITSTVQITPENEKLLATGYEARSPKELPVLSRWFEAGSVETKEAKFLDIILYSREQIRKETAAMGKEETGSDAPWGIISVKSQDVDHEIPMQPITMMRNALGKEEGGSGVALDRQKYTESVDFWRDHAPVK